MEMSITMAHLLEVDIEKTLIFQGITVSTLSAWLLVDTFDCRWIDWYTVNQSVERKIPKGGPLASDNPFGIHGLKPW